MKTLNSIRTLLLTATLLLHLDALCLPSHGTAGDVDLSFNPGSGVNGRVTAVAMQPDGKVIVAGVFNTVKSLTRTNLARLHADGSGDATFDAGPGMGRLTALALQPDGKLLVAGLFGGTVCDESGCYSDYRETVVRLNSDGSRDSTFAAATVEYSDSPREIRCLVPLPNGKILVGGYFYSINGTNRVGIARLQANGTLDPSFNTTPSLNGTVQGIVVQPDGKAIIGGVFTTSGAASRSGVARLNVNGSVDPTFDAGIFLQRDLDLPPYGPCSEFTEITALALQPDGRLLVGVFKRLYEIEDEGVWNLIIDRYFVERLHANGGNDPAFVFPNYAQMAKVGGLIVQPDGRVLVQHGFTTSRIARLNGSGSWDDSFQPGNSSGDAGAAALQPDGKVLIGGSSVTVGAEHVQSLSRLNADGSRDTTFDSGKGLERAVAQIALQPDGKVLLGGPVVVGDPYFGPASDVPAFVNGASRHGKARLNTDGSLDGGFIPNAFHPPVEARYHTEDCPGDPRFGCFYGFVSTALLVQTGGKILLAGNFITTVTGDEVFYQIYHSFLGRFTATGGLETEFNLPDVYVSAMAQQPDGKIVIGGSLTLNGTNSTVARLHADGSVDDSFQRGQGPASVSSLVMQPNGKVVVAGADTVARLDSNGSRDLGFGPVTLSNGVAATLALQPDGKVLVGGSFTSINGTNRHRIARLNGNGTLDHSFDPGAGPDGAVRTIALQPDGNVLIAGDFTTVHGVVRRYVARLHGADVAPALNIAKSNALVTISWPSSAGFVLDHSLTPTGVWSQVAFPYSTNAGVISLSVSASSGNRFYRLRKL